VLSRSKSICGVQEMIYGNKPVDDGNLILNNTEKEHLVSIEPKIQPFIKKSPHIINDNALRLDWKAIVPPDKLSYILGNPAFIGKHLRNSEQSQDMELIFTRVKNFGSLDYVTAWYIKAAQYIQGTEIKVAFVSTNSISQGEQVGILWSELFGQYHIKIHFAHKTFKWGNEAKNNAAVYVVIIGFANYDTTHKAIYEYDHPTSEAHQIKARNINPYLVDYEDLVVLSRSKSICGVQEMIYGNKPVDDGNLILNNTEKEHLVSIEPKIQPFIKNLSLNRLLVPKNF